MELENISLQRALLVFVLLMTILTGLYITVMDTPESEENSQEVGFFEALNKTNNNTETNQDNNQRGLVTESSTKNYSYGVTYEINKSDSIYLVNFNLSESRKAFSQNWSQGSYLVFEIYTQNGNKRDTMQVDIMFRKSVEITAQENETIKVFAGEEKIETVQVK